MNFSIAAVAALLSVAFHATAAAAEYESPTTTGSSSSNRLDGLPARNVCQASLAVAEDAYDTIRKLTSETMLLGLPLTVDNLDHPALVKEHQDRLKRVFIREFEEQNVPTQVVKMQLSEETRLQAIEDLKRVQSIQDKMDQILNLKNARGQKYTPFRLEFDPAVLFVPACLQFMSDNRKMVQEMFPEVHTCQCNAFSVKTGETPVGFHRASSFGYEHPDIIPRNWFAPEFHMSFHTALNPTNASSSPLVLFDGEMPAVFNDGYLLSQFEAETTWRPDLTRMARAALLAVKVVSFDKLYSLLQYSWAVYNAMKNCPNEEASSMGTFWELEPGEALFFNNWRVHSDHHFGSSEHERHTLDLRCYSKIETPFPFADERDFLATGFPGLATMQDTAAECMLRLFDYADEKDFYDFIGVKPTKRLSYALGSVLLNYVNAGDDGLLSEAMEQNMQKHAQRVRSMYDDGTLNYTAFGECVNQNKEKLAPGGPPRVNIQFILRFLAYVVSAGPLQVLSRLSKLAVLGMRIGLGATGEKFAMPASLLLSVYVVMKSKKKGKKVHTD